MPTKSHRLSPECWRCYKRGVAARWAEFEIIFLNGNREFARGSYGIINKCHIVGVDFIPRHEEYACKAFITSVERNAITTMNMEAMNCPLIHPLFIKLFAIHPTKALGYMRWWNAGTLRSMVNKYNKKSSIAPGVDEENVKLFQRYESDCLGTFYMVCSFRIKMVAYIVICLLITFCYIEKETICT